jgi:hypothetical protein
MGRLGEVARARSCSDGVSAHARRKRAARQIAAGDLHGDDVERVCPHAVGSGVLDREWRGIGPCGAHGGASAWRLRGYARALAVLHQGLDSVLSAASAWPAGQAARGFIAELLVWHPG